MIIRQIPVAELAVGMTLFVPISFSAYTVGSDGIARSIGLGPSIQGVDYEVLANDGTTVTARSERHEIEQDIPEHVTHVLIREEV